MYRFAARLFFVVFCALVASRLSAVEPEFSAADVEFFEKEVRPILVERCFACHSREAKELKGGLRLDSRAALLRGGDTGPAVIPGDTKKSLLVDAVNYGEVYQMPPKTKLPAAEIATLTKWVDRGAPWPKETETTVAAEKVFDLAARKQAHWCWQPIQSPVPPAVKNGAWPRSDLDRFILARLEAAGLSPSPPADRNTWLRRVTFDLIGLPPTPEQVAAFLGDDSPQAFERVVDELLKSPHFGERWARHWMDLVRYAETCGHEFDYPIREAWRYRDYLIRSFNADVPYDQFVIEHLAGDLLEQPRRHPTEDFNESILGTGFWFLHEAIHAPVDALGDQAIRIDNQIDVFSKTFLGVTVACARCHDHKFDAISTQDYYALAGVLLSSRRHEVLLDPGGKIAAITERIAKIRSETNAALVQSTAAETLSAGWFAKRLLAARAAAQPNADLASLAASANMVIDELQSWRAALTDPAMRDVNHPLHAWHALALQTPSSPIGSAFRAWQDGAVKQLAATEPTRADYPLLVDFDDGTLQNSFVTGFAFEKLPARAGDWDVIGDGVRTLPSGAVHSGLLAPKLQGVWRSPTFTLSHRNIHYRIAGRGCEARLVIDGYSMLEFHQLLFGGCKFPIETDGKWVWHRQAGDLGMYLGHRAYIEVIDHGDGWAAIDEICFSDRDMPPPVKLPTTTRSLSTVAIDSVEALAMRLGEQAGNREVVAWLWQHGLVPAQRRIAEAVRSARSQIDALAKELPTPQHAVAITEGTAQNERIFIRGNPRTPGDEAPRQLLTALVGRHPIAASGSGRLQLARQLVDPANPLTSRVIVNRIWHHLFGRGLVPTVDNFGVLGETPSHPELLDYLARQFTVEGWSTKRLIRTIVLSQTYRMASTPVPAAEAIDPTNRLLHRMNIRRLQGEALRDAMLTVSGRLDRTFFGPSVAVHITSFMQGRGRPKDSGPLDGTGRRSLYVETRRNFLSPMMLAFDTPTPFSTVGRRNISNVPAQALILMNDPLVIEQADRWAKHLLSIPSIDWNGRLSRAYISAFARAPSATELDDARAFFAEQTAELKLSEQAAVTDARVWTDFCHVLFNLKEFVYVE